MRSRTTTLLIALFAMATMAATNPLQLLQSQRDHEHKHEARKVALNAEVPAQRLSDVPCEDGFAGPFPCDGVDLLSFVPKSEFEDIEATLFAGISDIWGWTDPDNGDEYVIIGVSNGAAFFRVTDPTNPEYLGKLPNTAIAQLIWHDIKVYDNHAFIVSESNPHGMRVFDLTRLRGVTSPQVWIEDVRYPLNWAAHNIAINEDTGFAYIVGGNEGIVVPDHCMSGLHMIDINNPGLPTFAGCYTGDGYIHDTQCVVYDGPDAEHREKEICVNSSEDQVSVVDVTDKSNVQVLGRVQYPQTAYTHQGWFTEDQAYFLAGDELDETGNNPTRTLVFDLTDLDDPKLHFEHLHETRSIDHNMYVKDGLVYQSNYTTGLRVLDTSQIAAGSLEELAFFDTFPNHDNATFDGTWSNYPYFESGTIAVSGIDEGLFLLRLADAGDGAGDGGAGGGDEGGEDGARGGKPGDVPRGSRPDHAGGPSR